MNQPSKQPSYPLLGSRVNLVQYADIYELVGQWMSQQSYRHYVVVANTHVIMEARKNDGLRSAVDAADLVIPDGMPLVVMARLRGHSLPQRADGPGLMRIALSEKPMSQWRHFFYGSSAKVLQDLKNNFPEANIVGMISPPFRPLSVEEDQQMLETINACHPDLVWVGLGCPKQEIWMQHHHELVNATALVGVGQAFDILSGHKKRAPRWMQKIGLEWLYRLFREPRRVWKRYVQYNPAFILLAMLELLLTRKEEMPNAEVKN